MSGPLFSASNRGFGTRAKIFTAIAFLFTSPVIDASADNLRVEYSPVQYLKNFALSTCIAEGYASGDVVKDSSSAAGGYLELGSFPMEAYTEAASLGKKFLAKEYRGKHGEKLVLMKCIDLFNSEELEQLARKYDKK